MQTFRLSKRQLFEYVRGVSLAFQTTANLSIRSVVIQIGMNTLFEEDLNMLY